MADGGQHSWVFQIIEFYEKFGTRENYLFHLAELKWGNSYSCSKCQCKEYTKGYTFLARRCKNCKYEESVSATTLFHGVKFSMVKAFLVFYRMSTKKGMSTYEIAKEVGVTQKTRWIFCAKIRTVMESSGLHLLEAEVHVDEFVIGGMEKNRPVEVWCKKSPLLMIAEARSNNKIGRVYAKTN